MTLPRTKTRITFCPGHPGMGQVAIALLITNTTQILQIQLVPNFVPVDLYNNFQPWNYVNNNKQRILNVSIPLNEFMAVQNEHSACLLLIDFRFTQSLQYQLHNY